MLNSVPVICPKRAFLGPFESSYGHVHGPPTPDAFEGEADGVLWRCVSADRVGFTPALVVENTG